MRKFNAPAITAWHEASIKPSKYYTTIDYIYKSPIVRNGSGLDGLLPLSQGSDIRTYSYAFSSLCVHTEITNNLQMYSGSDGVKSFPHV